MSFIAFIILGLIAGAIAKAILPGEQVTCDVHVVSDLRHSLEDAVVTAILTAGTDVREWKWEGDIGPDECVRVGAVGAAGAPGWQPSA